MSSTLYRRVKGPFELFEIDIIGATKGQLSRVSRELGLGLNLEEMLECKRHFRGKGKNPTDVELQTLGQTWSEHCYHKTFKGEVRVGRRRVRLFKDYIARVTKELSQPWCISVFEDNAGIIDFWRGYGVAAKVETHNHPSAIDPFGGSATGLGGVIRDILGVWAEPIASTAALGFGPLDYPEKLPSGMKHPKTIFEGVVAGVRQYGDSMLIPNVAGGIHFDGSYVGNPVVYCGCIGILPLGRYSRDTGPGDVAVLAGGKTGREGIHGVTFASAKIEGVEEGALAAKLSFAPTAQAKLAKAIFRIRDEGLASGITDLGGGGISCAGGEAAFRSGCGLNVELEKVPLKSPGMSPWEIWISESQDRMFLTVPGENLERVLRVFEDESVEAVPIGKFVRGDSLVVTYRGQEIARLDLRFLFSPPELRRAARWKAEELAEPRFKQPTDLNEILLRLLASPNIRSKEDVIRTHEGWERVVLKPLHGKYGGPNDAAIVKPLRDSPQGVVISCGMNPSYGRVDPYWMAASNIEEALRNNVAVGGRRIALLDNFVWGSPEQPEKLGALVRACEACYDFAKNFGTPFVSGKDSLYNESALGSVTPTLLITGIGIIPDVAKAVSGELKEPGDAIYIAGRTYPELGGSEYHKMLGYVGKNVPKVRAKRTRGTLDGLTRAIDLDYFKACHDLSEGGLAVAAAEMVLGGDRGAELDLRKLPTSIKGGTRDDFLLFSESNGRFLIEVESGRERDFQKLMEGNLAPIGRVSEVGELSVRGITGEKAIEVGSEKLREAWKGSVGL